MKIDCVELRPLNTFLTFVFGLILPFLTSCVSAKDRAQPLSDDYDSQDIVTFDIKGCTASSSDVIANAGTDEETMAIARPVCIVFNDADCPIYTVFAGQQNGVPELVRGGSIDKLVWQAVKLDKEEVPDTSPPIIVFKYIEAAVKFQVAFDPFKGRVLKAPTGKKLSPPLACAAASGKVKDCVPAPADFKYTIWTLADDDGDGVPNCPPLDPVFRVNF